jgi:hypothetical protein
LWVAQVASGKVTSAYVDRFSCIALAGVSTEYIVFGQVRFCRDLVFPYRRLRIQGGQCAEA